MNIITKTNMKLTEGSLILSTAILLWAYKEPEVSNTKVSKKDYLKKHSKNRINFIIITYYKTHLQLTRDSLILCTIILLGVYKEHKVSYT